MKETLSDILDSILHEVIELIDQGLRPGFILAGRKQFVILMDAMKKEALVHSFPDIDIAPMLAGLTIVPDIFSDDRLDVAPAGSLRTDSILRTRRKRDHG